MLIANEGLSSIAKLLSYDREDGTLLRAKAIPQGMIGYLIARVVLTLLSTILFYVAWHDVPQAGKWRPENGDLCGGSSTILTKRGMIIVSASKPENGKLRFGCADYSFSYKHKSISGRHYEV
jgi:hypothetical protein